MKHRGASRAVTYLADLSAHAAALHQAAEHLFHSHQHYATQQPVPLFDVHTALSVVARGALDLPSFIGGVAPDVQPPKGKRGQLVGECNALLLQLLQSVQLPAGLRVLQVRRSIGSAVFKLMRLSFCAVCCTPHNSGVTQRNARR